MKANLILLISSILFTIPFIQGETFYFDPYTQEHILPTETNPTSIEITEDSLGVTVTYSLGSLCFLESESLSNCYSIDIKSFGRHCDGISPDIPVRVDQFSLPYGVKDIKLSTISNKSINYNATLITSKVPSPYFPDDSLSVSFRQDKIHTENTTNPLIKTHYLSINQNKGLAFIEVNPIQYDPEGKVLYISYDFSYRVDYIFEKDSTNIRANSTVPDKTIWRRCTPISETFLILSSHKFKDIITPFSDWKKRCGYNTITKTDNSWTESKVKSYIDSTASACNNLKYVLIVGDNVNVPGVYDIFYGWQGSHGERKYYSDFPYSCIENDDIPDIYIGRIPANDIDEAQFALNKILRYEQNPPTSDIFYDNVIHSAIFTLKNGSTEKTDEPFVYNAENVAEYVSQQGVNCFRNYSTPINATPKYWADRYGLGQELPVSLQKPNFSWNGTIDNINQQVERGVLYVLNNGHGAHNYIKCSSFGNGNYSTSDVEKLNNYNTYPLFFNMSCLAGNYSIDKVPSLSQSLIGHEFGAVAVFGASEYSCMGLTDAQMVGYINALWPNPGFNYIIDSYYYSDLQFDIYDRPLTLGRVYDSGRQMQIALYGLTYNFARYNQRVFHLFGDPSMIVHTSNPVEQSDIIIEVELTNKNLTPISPRPSDNEAFKKAHLADITVSLKHNPHRYRYITIEDGIGNQSTVYGDYAHKENLRVPINVTIRGQNYRPYFYEYNPTDTLVKGLEPSMQLRIKEITPNPMTYDARIIIERLDGSTDVFEHYQDIVVDIYSISGEYTYSCRFPKDSFVTSIKHSPFRKGLYVVVLSADGLKMDTTQLIVE